MANATIPATRAATPSAAPFILRAVGDVTRPHAVWPFNTDLRHLPGEAGLRAGWRNIFGPQRRGADHYVELQRRYGSVFRIQIGPAPLVVVAAPELLAEVLRNDDGVWSTALAWHAFFAGIDSSAETLDLLLTLDFEPHREARKLLQPAFSAAATARYLEMAQPMFETAIRGWLARGQTVFKADIRRLLASVSARTFLGMEDPAEGAMLDRTLADIWACTMAVTKNRWVSPSWRRGVRAHARLRSLLRARVPERRARGGEDLFSRLCAETRGARWLDDDGIVRLFMTILLGAFDTTALGLTSMAYLLARHPDWQERLRQEARSVGQGLLPHDDVKRLELTDCAWKETLRIMPVTGHMFRVPLRDVELAGARIPAGTFVLVTNGPLGRDDRWWEQPHRFDPERFAPARAEDKKHKGSFLPFGGGAHACIGTHLASAEVKAFWHAMLTRCRFRLQPDYDAHHVYLPLGCVSGQVRLAVEAAWEQGAAVPAVVTSSRRSSEAPGRTSPSVA